MKREHELNILLIASLVWVAVCIAVMFSTQGGGFGRGTSATGSRGMNFGNCLVQFQWTSQNHGPKEIVNLVVFSEEPSQGGTREKDHDTEAFAKFSDGSSSAIVPDATSIAWLAPGQEPRRIEVGDLRSIVALIEQHRSTSFDAQFNSPEEFLAGIKKLAGQASPQDSQQTSN